jgi:hypothetical protein
MSKVNYSLQMMFSVLTSASVGDFPFKRSFLVHQFSLLGWCFFLVLLDCLVSSN